MHRIDGPSATPDGKFTDGSPTGGVPATIVSDDWLNDVQENIVAVIAAAGVTLTKGRANDLLDAINSLLTGASDQVLANIGRKLFKGGFFVQWGRGTTSATGPLAVTFAVGFTEIYSVVGTAVNTTTFADAFELTSEPVNSGFSCATVSSGAGGSSSQVAAPFRWIAVGKL